MNAVTSIRAKHTVLEDAAELMRLLAAVERAHLFGDEEKLVTLLGQVTPSTCDGIADELASFAQQARAVHGASRAELLRAVRGSSPSTGAESAHPLAPVVVLDPHLRRV